jgi:hypothetical protein
MNKLSNDANEEFSEVLGEIFSTLLQIMMNIEFLLYIKKSKIKNNIIKNKKRNYSKRPTKDIDKEFRRLTSKDLIKFDDKKNDDNKSDDKSEQSNKNNFKSIISKFKIQLNLNDMIISSNKKYQSSIINENENKDNDSKEKEDIGLAFFSKKAMSYNPSDNSYLLEHIETFSLFGNFAIVPSFTCNLIEPIIPNENKMSCISSNNFKDILVNPLYFCLL